MAVLYDPCVPDDPVMVKFPAKTPMKVLYPSVPDNAKSWMNLFAPFMITPAVEALEVGRVMFPATWRVELGAFVPTPRRRLALSQKKAALFWPRIAVVVAKRMEPAVPEVTAPPIEAPEDGVAQERTPEPLVERTWPDDPSADGQPYATPFKVVVAVTAMRAKEIEFVPDAVIVGEEPVKARVDEVTVTPLTVFAFKEYAELVMRWRGERVSNEVTEEQEPATDAAT